MSKMIEINGLTLHKEFCHLNERLDDWEFLF